MTFTVNGKRYRETLNVNGEPAKPTPANVKWAHRLAAEIKDRIRHGTFSLAEYFPLAGTAGAPMTVALWLETWLTSQLIESSTRAGYESAVRFWKAAIGDKPLRGLKHSDILIARAARKDLSGKTINNYTDVLSAAMALALRDKLIPQDPCNNLERAVWQQDPPDPFSLDEAERIILAMPEGPVRNVVEFWFFTGVRTSEMAGLHWDQVDLADGYVRISEAMVRGKTKGTKTGVVRDVQLNSRALAALTRQKAHTFLAGEHVWLDPRYGTPWTEERAFRRSYWTPTLKRLGIRYRRPYNMRHTYATMMLMAPEANAAWSAGQMGHSVEVFLRTYTKWINGAQDKRQMGALESWIARTGT